MVPIQYGVAEVYAMYECGQLLLLSVTKISSVHLVD